MLKNLGKKFALWVSLLSCSLLVACSSNATHQNSKKASRVQIENATKVASIPTKSVNNSLVSKLNRHHSAWKGTRYRLGGTSKKGVDCSGFTQLTYKELFGVNLPRMTVDQAKVGRRIKKSELRAGDLVFFNTGRGPNGKHVGIFVKGDQFLHASSKAGVTYSSLNSPYWSKVFWQARRL